MGFPGTWMTTSESMVYRVVPKCACSTIGQIMYYSDNGKFFDGDKLQRGVGIKFKDRVRTDIEEYCISEGWIRVQAGKSVDRRGRPLTIKLKGPVEAWYEDLGDNPPVAKL